MAKKGAPRYTYPIAHKGDDLGEYQCVSFFIPIGWWNRASMIGAFYQMGYSFMWPDDDYGEQVAERWRDGYWLSLENNFMASATEVINNNYITVTCGCGGGGSTDYLGGVQSQAESMPASGQPVNGDYPVNLPPNSVEPLPDGYEGEATDWGEYADDKCQKINYMVDRLIASMHSMVGTAESGLEYSVAGLATAVALAIAEPLFFGEVALIAIVITPQLVRLLGHFGLDTQELHDAIDDIDKCGLVSAVYSAETAGAIPSIVESFISGLLDSLGVNSRVSDFLAWYSTLAINQTTIDWVFLGIGQFMPSDYVGTCLCDEPVQEVEWVNPWTFPTDLQGWARGSASTMEIGWFDYGSGGDVHSPPGAMYALSQDPTLADLAEVTAVVPSNVDKVITNATVMRVWCRTSNAFVGQNPTVSWRAEFRDGTQHTSESLNIGSVTNSRDIILINNAPEHNNKVLDRLTLIAETPVNWGNAGASIRFDDIEIIN